MELIALLLSATHFKGDYINWQFSVGLAMCCIPISVYLSKKMGLLFGVFSAYFLIHSVCATTNFYAKNMALPIEFQNQLSITSGFSLLYALIIFFGIFLMEGNNRRRMRIAFAGLVVVDALYVINSWRIGFALPGGRGYTGLLDYCGMNGTLMALGCAFLIPQFKSNYLLVRTQLISLTIVIAAIILSKTAIPFGVIGIVIAGNLFVQNRKLLGFVLFPIFMSLLIGYATVGSKMADSSRRFEAYSIFMSFLKNEKKLTFGTSLGTLRDWAPTIQYRAKFMVDGHGGWVWDKLHSDFLQLWFEQGWISFLMIIALYFQCLYRAYKMRDASLFSLGIGLGGAASLNYPLRYFSTSALVAYFIVASLKLEKHKTEPGINYIQ